MKNKLYYHYIGSSLLLIFVFLGYVIRFYPEWLTGFDTSLTAVIRGIPYATSFFLWITKFASPLTIIILTIILSLGFLKRKRYAETLWLLLGVGGIAGGLNTLLKLVFARERPTLEHLVTEHSYSFPSGHSVGSMILYGTLLFILPSLISDKRICRLIQVCLGCLILSVGISRVFLGVHFPSDILGGYALGLAWLFLSYPSYDRRRFIWRFTQKQN